MPFNFATGRSEPCRHLTHDDHPNLRAATAAKWRRITPIDTVMPYSDIDGSVETAFDELYKAFDQFIEEMDVSTDWLNQEVGS